MYSFGLRKVYEILVKNGSWPFPTIDGGSVIIREIVEEAIVPNASGIVRSVIPRGLSRVEITCDDDVRLVVGDLKIYDGGFDSSHLRSRELVVIKRFEVEELLAHRPAALKEFLRILISMINNMPENGLGFDYQAREVLCSTVRYSN
ncbi:hypothetical protein CEXT_263281 [Caerostris extrusa]|uniref:Uncharacterized protein n=1 Tax=Caerostris extrusa TaxID=172846 RepID=A0AAV4W5W2_CAEEX|nr:hypothetical protein CEXT_263281 [Caerostris extrusa]